MPIDHAPRAHAVFFLKTKEVQSTCVSPKSRHAPTRFGWDLPLKLATSTDMADRCDFSICSLHVDFGSGRSSTSQGPEMLARERNPVPLERWQTSELFICSLLLGFGSGPCYIVIFWTTKVPAELNVFLTSPIRFAARPRLP